MCKIDNKNQATKNIIKKVFFWFWLVYNGKGLMSIV